MLHTRNRLGLSFLLIGLAAVAVLSGGCPTTPSDAGGIDAIINGLFGGGATAAPEPASVEVAVNAPASAASGATVALQAVVTGSGDLSGLTYRWVQTEGRAVEIAGATTPDATFVAPSLGAQATLRFRFDARTPGGAVASAAAGVAIDRDPDFGIADPNIDDPETDLFPRVRLETSLGDILVELNREKAPLTVNNFLRYLDDGHYENTIFHRVIPEFVVQGGGFEADLTERETRDPIRSEADNGLQNDRGTIAMARTNEPDSATSQFYFNIKDNDNLNHTTSSAGYTVFGTIVEGLDVMDEIAGVETHSEGGFTDVPVDDVILERAVRVRQ